MYEHEAETKEEAARDEGKERRYPLRAVYKDAANPHPRGRRAAGEVDMFISLRNLLGLRYREARKRKRKTKNGEKQVEEGIVDFRDEAVDDTYGSMRVSKGSLAVVGTSLRNVHAVFAD